MLKTSQKSQHLTNLIAHVQQSAPNPLNMSIFSPPNFPLDDKPFARTQPINVKSQSKHKKSASTTKYNPLKKDSPETPKLILLQDADVLKIIEQSDNLIKNNELIEGINLLKALKDPAIKFPNPELKIIILMNLAVAYYQTGFLEEAFDQFSQLSLALSSSTGSKPTNKLLYTSLLGKVQLQICILFSEMGKHEEALKHANKSCKVHFQLVYDVLNSLCKQLIQKKKSGFEKEDNQENASLKNLINNVILLEHLHKLIGDLNQIFHVPQKIKLSKELLSEIKSSISHYKNLKIDMELLFADDENELKSIRPSPLDWIFTNKILDQIQLKSLSPNFFSKQFSFTNAEIVQRITYLAISFYCYSTEIRFIEKNKPSKDESEVMDSEHWLSRSLQIAYSFMPPNAPILNQILTVHDRFHGIDKQTIPEDREICGYFKVLKPLSKPKSTYSSKSHMCSPIMIRIQAPKITIDIEEEGKGLEDEEKGKIFDLESLTKNNKIKGLNTRIKILEFSDMKPNETLKTIRHPTHLTETTKITSRSTISDLGSIETEKQKKIRISKIYHANRKTIDGKYNDFREEPKSMCELEGKAIISEDLLHRPFSYQKNINKWEKIQATTKAYSTQHAKRRKSLPSKNKEKLQKIVYNGSIKLDGLKLTGKKLNETFDIDQSFLERLSEAHNNEESVSLNPKGTPTNIFINNSINLYISKGQQFPKTSRELSEGKEDLGKRQKFINKRRLSHLNIYPIEQLQL